jgi:VirE N-terminal domain
MTLCPSAFADHRIDVDGCDDPAGMRAKLANDPFVQAAVVSPTSTGIKALVRINADADTHVACFAMARKHFEEAYEMSIDESCKNLSRLCYVAHDPDAFVRDEDAKLLVPLKPEPKAAGRTTPPPRDIDIELTAKCGPPFYASENDKLVINQNYFVQRICRENLVFFEHDENRFYRYNAENGAWEALAPGVIKESVRFEWERFTRLFNEPALAFKATDSFLHAFTGVESHSGRTKGFQAAKAHHPLRQWNVRSRATVRGTSCLLARLITRAIQSRLHGIRMPPARSSTPC